MKRHLRRRSSILRRFFLVSLSLSLCLESHLGYPHLQLTQPRMCKLTQPRARFVMKLTVQDENSELSATLFDAAEKIVGCTATKYNALNPTDAETKRANAIGKTYRFYTDVTKVNDDGRRQGRVIVEDVEETQNTSASKGSGSTTQKLPMLKNIKNEN